MKKIAITQRLIENETYYEVRETLDINYCKLVRACGFLPIVLPYETDFEEYFKELGVDGVLLTGGNDLDSCSSSNLSKKRDIYEKNLLEYCILNNIPVFGICRGMQLIAQYFGSSLKKVNGEVNTRHRLIVNKNSKYSNYLQKIKEVNSYHNFAIDDLSDSLIISASNDNEIIKAIEHKEFKIFGQMWHSEREELFEEFEIRLIQDFFNEGVFEVIEIAKKASTAIMTIYNKDFKIDYKEDDSPVTKADLVANEIIVNGLQKISHYPIVTEENPISYDKRKNWTKFWLVDPLDGTKDFIAKNGEFTVNIALVDKSKPILGVVFIPATNDVYWAIKNGGAYKNGEKIYNTSSRENLIGSDSNFHSTDMTKDFFNKHNITQINRFGSSIKLCKLAEGEIDVYPRLNGTKEWDTAASHMIANEAGCKLIDVKTKQELIYNKENIKNNYFIASRNDLEFEI